MQVDEVENSAHTPLHVVVLSSVRLSRRHLRPHTHISTAIGSFPRKDAAWIHEPCARDLRLGLTP
jgi:hypothetical protein